MRIRYALLVALMVLVSAAAMAQNGTVKGFVYDKKTGEPMIYTTILFKGTKHGGQTDVNGYFSITLPAGSYTMYTTSVGYDTALTDINLLPGAIITKKLLLNPAEQSLKEVEVSSHKTEKITRINIGTTTIAPREIKLLPSAGGEPDVAQFLQVVPGVVFTGDQGGQLFIRGGSPAQTGIYLDGVTIYNPFHSIGLFSVFETEAIRNVDVYTGGFDAQYGNRTSAIVDVHTKDGNKNQLAGIVSVSPIMSRALIEGPIVRSKRQDGSGISFLVSAKTSYLDQTSKSLYGGLGQPFSNGLNYKFTDVYGKVTFSGDNGSKLNLFGFSFNDKAQLADSLQGAAVISNYHWQAVGGGANFVVTPGNTSALIDGKFAYSNYNIGLSQVAFDPQPKSSSIGGFEANINFTYFLPNYSELKYGVEVSGFHTSLAYNIADNIQTTEDRQSTLAGAFIMYRKNFGEKFILEPSVRFQYYSELSKLSPEPRLGLKYNITENIRLKASGGIYSQNIISTKSDVDIVNLFTGFLLSPDQQITNSNGQVVTNNLQTAYHILGGIEVDVPESYLEFNLEPWYKYFPQIIELNRYKLFPSQPDFVAGSGYAEGIDFSAKYNHDRLYLWAVFGYQQVNYTNISTDGSQQTYPAPFDARLNINLVGSYTAGKKHDWDFSARFNLRSPFPFTQTQGYYENTNLLQNGLGTNPNTQNGTMGLLYAEDINGGRLSYYHRLDVSVKKRFKLTKNSNLDATFSLTNVYDRQNIFYIDRYTNVRVYQLPIFPSLNLTWAF